MKNFEKIHNNEEGLMAAVNNFKNILQQEDYNLNSKTVQSRLSKLTEKLLEKNNLDEGSSEKLRREILKKSLGQIARDFGGGSLSFSKSLEEGYHSLVLNDLMLEIDSFKDEGELIKRAQEMNKDNVLDISRLIDELKECYYG